jgi:hypothetical protein
MNQLNQYAQACAPSKARAVRIKRKSSPDLIMMLRDGRIVRVYIDIEVSKP